MFFWVIALLHRAPTWLGMNCRVVVDAPSVTSAFAGAGPKLTMCLPTTALPSLRGSSIPFESSVYDTLCNNVRNMTLDDSQVRACLLWMLLLSDHAAAQFNNGYNCSD